MSIIKVIIAGLVVAMTAGVIVFVARPEAIQVPVVGAVASPDIPSPYLQWGGVATYKFVDTMEVASTTCSIQSPAATSSLRYAFARVSSNATGATTQYEWGKSASPNATTTSLGLHITGLASAAQGVIIASTTNTVLIDDNTVFAPNQYLNLKIGSSSPNSTLAGNCYAEFVALP